MAAAALNKIATTSKSRQHPSELETSIATALYDLESNIPDMKSALRPLQFVSAREVSQAGFFSLLIMLGFGFESDWCEPISMHCNFSFVIRLSLYDDGVCIEFFPGLNWVSGRDLNLQLYTGYCWISWEKLHFSSYTSFYILPLVNYAIHTTRKTHHHPSWKKAMNFLQSKKH